MMNQTPHDLYYLKARLTASHGQRLSEMSGGYEHRQRDVYNVRKRLMAALGDVLIVWGQKMKGELEIKELHKDCA